MSGLSTRLVFLYESDEGCSLDFDWLSGSVVKSNYEMEEVWFSQVTRRLLLEVRPADAQTAIEPTERKI